jgi:tetratricopeptide (TPR) repeat protein
MEGAVIAALWTLLVAAGLHQDAADPIAEARGLIRQGLLAEAASALDAVPPDALASVRAHRDLLLGNVAFERGRYAAALSRYQRAEELFRQADDADMAAAAGGNLRMASERLARGEDLRGRLLGLKAAILALLAAGVGLVGVLSRRFV